MKKKGRNNKKKSRETVNNQSQKKLMIIIGAIIVSIAIFLLLNSGDQKILKSEYSMGEDGYADDIAIKLTDAVYINNDTGIEITFKITNKRNNTITIVPDDYFKFYDINKVQIPNKYTNDNNILKKNETINYKLQYDVTKKELYEIYFYSQIVENNVKFTFKSSDIRVNDIENNDKLENAIE